MDSSQTDDSLCLEETEQGYGVGSNVSSSIGVAQTRSDSSRDQAKTSDDGGDPANGRLIDGLGVGQIGLHTRQHLASVPIIDIDANFSIEIWHSIGNTGNLVANAGRDGDIGVDGRDLSRLQWAETWQSLFAGVDRLIDDCEAVGDELQVCGNVSIQGRDTSDLNGELVVGKIRQICDVEQCRGESGGS